MKNTGEVEQMADRRKIFLHFDTTVLPRCPLASHIVALMMVKTPEGGEIFPNANPESVLLIPNNDDIRHLKNPTHLHLGCGLDPRFDPRAHAKYTWDSASTMLNRHLGLRNPGWVKIIEEARGAFRGRKLGSGEIALMNKSLLVSHGGSEEGDLSVIRWVETAYNAELSQKTAKAPLTKDDVVKILRRQNSPDLDWFVGMIRECQSFYDRSKTEAQSLLLDESKFRLHKINHVVLGQLNVRTVVTDNPLVSGLCWKTTDTDVLIVRGKMNGRTVIQTRSTRNLDMTEVWQKLVEIDGSNIWDLLLKERMILNGCASKQNVLPSGITLKNLVKILEEVFSQKEYLNLLRPSVGGMLEKALKGA